MAAKLLPVVLLLRLINLLSFLWKILLNENIKTMTSKKVEDLIMKIVLFIRYFFQKNWNVSLLDTKIWKKHLPMLVTKYLKISLNTSADSYHQHRIRSKTGISLKIYLNVLKCLTLPLVLLKFLLWQWHHFCFISCLFLAASVNLLWCQVCTLYACPLRKKWCTLLLEGADVHIWQHIHQKHSKLCLPLHYSTKGTVFGA